MESCRTSARGQRNHAGTHPQSNYLLTKDQRTCLFIPYTKNIHGVISKWDNGVMQSAGISCKHVDGCLTVASWPWLPVASGPFKVEQLAKPETVKVFYIWWQFWPTYNFWYFLSLLWHILARDFKTQLPAPTNSDETPSTLLDLYCPMCQEDVGHPLERTIRREQTLR